MMSVSRENSFCCTWVFFLSICNTMLNWLFFLFCFCFYFVCANIIYIRMITFDRKDVVGVFWSDKSKNCLLLVDGSRGRLLGKKEDIYDVVWEKKIKCVLEKKIIDDYVVFLSFQARDTCPPVGELRPGETAIQLPEVDSPDPLPGSVRVRGLPPGPEPLSPLKFPEHYNQ